MRRRRKRADIRTEEKQSACEASGMCMAAANPHHVLPVRHAASSTDTLILRAHTELGGTALQMKKHFLRQRWEETV